MIAGNYTVPTTKRKLEIANHTIARLERELEEARKLDNADIEAFHDVYTKNTVLEAENAALQARITACNNKLDELGKVVCMLRKGNVFPWYLTNADVTMIGLDIAELQRDMGEENE